MFIGEKELTKPSQLVDTQAQITVVDADEYVSRAGLKLKGALEKFAEIDVVGKLALDVGASTGGFTDVLLR